MRRIRATLKGIAKIIHEIIHKTISGFGNVTLEYPVADGLEAVTLYGGTEQDDTDKVTSVTLEGATVQRNVPEGYEQPEYLRNVLNSTKFNTGIVPQIGDVLEIVWTAGSTTTSNYLFQSRTASSAGIYGISGSSSNPTIMGNWGSGQSLASNLDRINGHKYYTKMSMIGTTLTLTVRDLTNKTEDTKSREITTTTPGTAKYYIWGNSAQTLGTSQNVYYVKITNNGVVRGDFVPAKQGNTIGFYNKVSKTFMSTFVGSDPTASTTTATAIPFIPMDIVCNNGAIRFSSGTIYTEGEVETVQDSSGNTATAEMLMALLSSYKDTQEVLTGAITRKTAIKVLNGTESWYVNTGDYNFFRLNSAVSYSGNLNAGFYCTHFEPVAVASSTNNQGIRINSNSIFLRYDILYPATTENLPLFKQWLAQQYANGTPVIVVYPITTATTESVAGQELVGAPITQTAGSISNMTIITTSDGGIPTPSTPKDIICNNGVLKCSKNLLNLEDLEGSYLLTDSGQRGSSNDSWFLTNFIKVKPSTSYVFDFISGGDYVYRRICGYSSNDYNTFTELLIKKQRPTNENERYSLQFTTSATTNYIKISSHRFDTNIQLIEGTEAIPYHKYGIYTEGDTETVEDEAGNTATAENLVKVKDVFDTQEILNGDITRKNKILVLNGTENWTESGTSGSDDHRFLFRANASNKAEFSVCTHISRIIRTSTTIQTTRPCIRFSQDGVNMFWYSADNTQTLASFKQRLADQLANGTPVIVVYPLATATTESVTGQTLTSVAGDTNTIEITQAGMNPTDLQLEVDYLGYDM